MPEQSAARRSLSLKRWFAPDRRWPSAIVFGMTVFVAINIAFVTIALRHRPQLVSESYYAEGYNLRDIAERKAATQAAGWRVSVTHLSRQQAGMPLAQVEVMEANGLPGDSLSGSVSFYRPSDRSLDVAALTLHSMGAGKYFATLPHPLEHGAWQAIVKLSRGRQHIEQRVGFFVD